MEQLEFFDNGSFAIKDANYKGSEDEIVLTSNVVKDEYTQYIQDCFDLQVRDVSRVCIPNRLDLSSLCDWNIGVICGASGSGKSTILKHLQMQSGGCVSAPTFDNSKCLISNFDNMTPQEASMLLSQMGLASIPTWIRPYNVLSNGEQYRAMLAKQVSLSEGDDIIYIDEYTSVVDRNVAKSMSNALQKYIRKNSKRIVLCTCHYDILDWLRPDWIYDLNKGGVLERGDYLRQSRPQIELQVYRTTSYIWERFKKHHYMTQEMNMSAYCFCFEWNNTLVGFCSVLPNPGKGIHNGVRLSRLVVLPDFQGLGIGRRICDFISSIYKNSGYTMYIKTVNPSLGEYMSKSDNYSPTAHNGKQREVQHNKRFRRLLTRSSYCFKYVGRGTSGYEDLVLNMDDIKGLKRTRRQITFDF